MTPQNEDKWLGVDEVLKQVLQLCSGLNSAVLKQKADKFTRRQVLLVRRNSKKEIGNILLSWAAEIDKQARIGWQIEVPDYEHFQILAYDENGDSWKSGIYDTQNLPAQLNKGKSELNKLGEDS